MAGPEDCWLWQRSTNKKGYGYFQADKLRQAHRFAYMLAKGEIPEGMVIMHSCDTPGCCNPAHLSTGTWADNAHDRDRKGRQVPMKGSKHGRAKLTEADIRAIRADNRIQREIAADYGIDRANVSEIKSFKIWRHVFKRVPRTPLTYVT